MRSILILVLTFLASGLAHAETELACWNMYAKTGSRPILKAKIQKQNALELAFNLKDSNFESYFIDETKDSGERWGHKPAYTKSSLVNPSEALPASEITTNRSPYKGNNEYTWRFGTYSFRSPYYNTQGAYDVRLILPKNLSSAFLKQYRIRDPKERSNGVLILPPYYGSSSGGDTYIRLFCQSR